MEIDIFGYGHGEIHFAVEKNDNSFVPNCNKFITVEKKELTPEEKKELWLSRCNSEEFNKNAYFGSYGK